MFLFVKTVDKKKEAAFLIREKAVSFMLFFKGKQEDFKMDKTL
jgi:hypothetical protein